ncbi:MAG: hypothetical protein QM730_06755 [Anaerolineales bacterium]
MSRQSLSRPLLFFAVLFGAFVRIYPVWMAGFPVNDGGMFYQMVQDLVSAGFRLPTYTTYNQLNIPFAYPPLPFYLAGFVHHFLQIPLMDVIRWLPMLVSILTIPAFYWLARIVLSSEDKAVIATLFFAFMPRSFEWLIMGGGLTRAPASLFFILFAGSLIKAFCDQERKYTFYTILFGGLVLLSHPERSLHALTTGLLLFLFFGRTKRGLVETPLIGAGVALLSFPWWGMSLLRFGLEPLLQASRAGGDRALFWSPLLLLNITDETIAVTALLAVIGVMFELSRRRWFLPLWLVLTFATDPRSAPHVAPIQLSLLAAIALMDVILPALVSVTPAEGHLNSKAGKTLVLYFLVIGLVNGLSSGFTLAGIHVSEHERDALKWISQNISSSGKNFLIYPRESDAALSPMLEWFPALTKQTSLSTYQGREWLDGQLHSDAFFETRNAWLSCENSNEKCLDDWMSSSGADVNYVLIVSDTEKSVTGLSASLANSSQYILIYQNAEVTLYQRTP